MFQGVFPLLLRELTYDIVIIFLNVTICELNVTFEDSFPIRPPFERLYSYVFIPVNFLIRRCSIRVFFIEHSL